MLDPKRVIKIITVRKDIAQWIIVSIFCMESLRFRSWKDFSLGWWNGLASAWFPDVRHFENLTPWIQLGLGLRDRAWKPTSGHSRKLAQLSTTIFSKFWSRDHYAICIHGSRSRCFTCIAERVTSEVVDMFSRGGGHWTVLIIAIAATSAAVSWQFAGWISPIPPLLYSTAVNKVWCLQCGQMF